MSNRSITEAPSCSFAIIFGMAFQLRFGHDAQGAAITAETTIETVSREHFIRNIASSTRCCWQARALFHYLRTWFYCRSYWIVWHCTWNLKRCHFRQCCFARCHLSICAAETSTSKLSISIVSTISRDFVIGGRSVALTCRWLSLCARNRAAIWDTVLFFFDTRQRPCNWDSIDPMNSTRRNRCMR
jgi:hypothetical protein